MSKHNLIAKLFFFLVICLAQMTIIKSDQCEEIMLAYLNNLNPLDLKNPINSIGTGVDNLGDYDICTSENTNKYILFKFKTENNYPINENFSFYTGICLPEICTTPENIDKIKSKISEVLNIKKEEIQTTDSGEENEKLKSFGISEIIILSFLCIYLLLATGLLKYLIDLFSKKNDDKSSATNQQNETGLKKNPASINVANASYSKSIITNTNDKDSDELLDNRDRGYSSFHRKSIANDITDTPQPSSEPTTAMMHSNELSDSIESVNKLTIDENSIIDNCFDIQKNIKTIFKEKQEHLQASPELKIFDGINVFSILVIIFNAFADNIRKIPLRNPDRAYDDYRSFIMQLFLNVTFPYDTLFAISGFLLAYKCIISKQEVTGLSVGKILKLIVQKLLKIWPLYAMIFLFYWKFFAYTLDGPISGNTFYKELESCKKQWPFVLTMLSNFTYGLWEESPPYCFNWSWYFQNDVQYYIIGIILMAVFTKSKRIFWIIFPIALIASFSIEGWLLWDLKIGVNIFELEENKNYYKYYYYKMYTRSSPFFLGMLFGTIYANYKTSLESHHFSRTRNLFELIQRSGCLTASFYLVGLITMLGCIFSTYWSYDNTWNFTEKFIYNFIGKKLFVIGLFAFLLPLFLGKLNFFGGWLGSDAFNPLSKLSVAALLTYPLLMEYFFFNLRYSVYFSAFYYVVMSISFWGSAYLLSMPVRLLFEMPFVQLKNLINGNSLKFPLNDLEEGKQNLLNLKLNTK